MINLTVHHSQPYVEEPFITYYVKNGKKYTDFEYFNLWLRRRQRIRKCIEVAEVIAYVVIIAIMIIRAYAFIQYGI